MSGDPQREELGRFIRWHRENTPPQGGPRDDPRRRAKGLRRSEVADQVGISQHWYTLLEQGRAEYVSTQVLYGVAAAFRLSAAETEHMFRLAGKPLPPDLRGHSHQVSQIVRSFLEAQCPCPAYIFDSRWDIVAWNECAPAVLYDLSKLPKESRNILWAVFCVPEVRESIENWSSYMPALLASFRLDYGRNPNDPRRQQLVARLLSCSEEFRNWWHEPRVDDQASARLVRIYRSKVKLVLDTLTFTCGDNPDLRVLIFMPAPDTDTAKHLKRLARASQVAQRSTC